MLKKLGFGIDPQGLLFNCDGRIVRGIRPGHGQFYRKLLENKVVQELMAGGALVETWVSNVELAGFETCLEHRRVEPVTYPHEWPVSAIADAATAILDLNKRLMAAGYCLQDGHLWNILFEGVRPVFIDFTSIIPYDGGRWVGAGEFCAAVLDPLRLIRRGFSSTVRAVMRTYDSPPERGLALSVAAKTELGSGRLAELTSAATGPAAVFIDRLRDIARRASLRMVKGRTSAERSSLNRELSRLRHKPQPGMWTDYLTGKNELPTYDGSKGSLDAFLVAARKPQCVVGVVDSIQPKRLLDIGCNRGTYVQYAARNCRVAVGIDTDEAVLNQMYNDSKGFGSIALPLYVNVATPNEANTLSVRQFPATFERLRADLVLCLALVHHLVLGRQRMSFEEVAETLSRYTAKALVVEFVPATDKFVRILYPDVPEWYRIDIFKESLSKYFGSIEERPSDPDPRRLLVCAELISSRAASHGSVAST